MKKLILLSIILCFCKVVEAQCTFDPTINGEFILCPNSTTILSTQIYDSYQWHRRLFTEPNSSPIPGDTLQTIEVSSDSDTPYFFSVETTLDGCTEFSPEELVDGLTFLPVAVISTGDFETGNNGESIVCMGDTINYTLNLPYDTNITWFKDGVSISGETSISLSVSTPGQYGVRKSFLLIV